MLHARKGFSPHIYFWTQSPIVVSVYDLKDESSKKKKNLTTIFIFKWLVDWEMDHLLVSSIPGRSIALAANFWPQFQASSLSFLDYEDFL